MEFKAIHLATKLGGTKDDDDKQAGTGKCSCPADELGGKKDDPKKGAPHGLAVLQEKLREKLAQEMNAGV